MDWSWVPGVATLVYLALRDLRSGLSSAESHLVTTLNSLVSAQTTQIAQLKGELQSERDKNLANGKRITQLEQVVQSQAEEIALLKGLIR